VDVVYPVAMLVGGLFVGWKAGAWIGALRRRALTEREAEERAAREAALQERETALQERERTNDEARRQLAAREAVVDQRAEATERRENDVLTKARDGERLAEQVRSHAASILAEAKGRLAEVAGLPAAEARRRLLETLERELVDERARRVLRVEEQARAEGEQRARDIVLTTIQRLATEHASKASVTVVQLPTDEMKGRVIGREGRNVKALEAATGCDVLVDEAQPLVTISCFDGVRREIARDALEVLIEDGRIQPARIEEVVVEARARVAERMREAARQALREADVGEASDELVLVLGRLAFRTSYGQNVLRHSVEAAHIAGGIAAELGLEARVARRAALFHDLGKALDLDQGPHATAAGALLRRLGEPPEVVAAAEEHHDDLRTASPYAVLAQVADALSSARPGARLEPAELQIRRLADLERLAARFEGVEQVYALQAGREVRVIVDAAKVSDARAPLLAHEIARAVEAELHYAGEVRVTVVREVRAVNVAR